MNDRGATLGTCRAPRARRPDDPRALEPKWHCGSSCPWSTVKSNLAPWGTCPPNRSGVNFAALKFSSALGTSAVCHFNWQVHVVKTYPPVKFSTLTMVWRSAVNLRATVAQLQSVSEAEAREGQAGYYSRENWLPDDAAAACMNPLLESAAEGESDDAEWSVAKLITHPPSCWVHSPFQGIV